MSTTPTDLLHVIAGYSNQKFRIVVNRIDYDSYTRDIILELTVFVPNTSGRFNVWWHNELNPGITRENIRENIKEVLLTHPIHIESYDCTSGIIITQGKHIEFANNINWDDVV